MDLDAFAAVRDRRWARLDELTRRRRLTGAEADELVQLYQAVATDLSTVRSAAPDAATVARLSDLLGRARSAIAGAARARAGATSPGSSSLSLPAALYRIRWWTVAVTRRVPRARGGRGRVGGDRTPDALAAMGTPSERRSYAEDAFAQYYDPSPGLRGDGVDEQRVDRRAVRRPRDQRDLAAVRAGQQRGRWSAPTGGMMADEGRLDLFLQLIAPHGLLELTAVFVAGAAGLRLFWTWVDPGRRTAVPGAGGGGARAVHRGGRARRRARRVRADRGLPHRLVPAVGGQDHASARSPWPRSGPTRSCSAGARWRAGHTGDLDTDRAGHVLPVAG